MSGCAPPMVRAVRATLRCDASVCPPPRVCAVGMNEIVLQIGDEESRPVDGMRSHSRHARVTRRFPKPSTSAHKAWIEHGRGVALLDDGWACKAGTRRKRQPVPDPGRMPSAIEPNAPAAARGLLRREPRADRARQGRTAAARRWPSSASSRCEPGCPAGGGRTRPGSSPREPP